MKLRDLLELCRVSNLPTVWSNAALGYLAGVVTDSTVRLSDHPDSRIITSTEFVEVLSGNIAYYAILLLSLILPYSAFYCGGMVLNDYLDHKTDARERPERPIPSGRVRPKTAYWLFCFLLAVGLSGVIAFSVFFGWQSDRYLASSAFGLALVTTIVFYNATHLQRAWSVLLMGACRGLVVLTAAAAVIEPTLHGSWLLFVAGPAMSLLIYTVLISIVARREVEAKRFAGPKTIMNMIAAMPLLDAAWLLIMGLWPASLFCVACAGLTKLAHRKVAGS